MAKAGRDRANNPKIGVALMPLRWASVGGSLQAAIDHPASDAWLAVVFFAVLGVASWQIGRAAKYILAGFSTHAPIRPPTFPHPRVTARK
jgi:hypothetical protein